MVGTDTPDEHLADRPRVIVRKVQWGMSKDGRPQIIRAGIYTDTKYPIPVKTISPGERYAAKIRGRFYPVVSQPNEVMLLTIPEDPSTDPRTRAAIRGAHDACYDINAGRYTR